MIRTPPHARSRWLLAALLTLTACAAAPRTGASPSDDRAARIVAMLDASAVAWNQNDLDGFLEPYGPDATFVGSSGLVRGLPAIRERYVQSYWSSGAPGESLRFENIEVRPFGSDHALAVGEYVVTNRTTGAEGRGFFSLMLARTPVGWRIVHDHSS